MTGLARLSLPKTPSRLELLAVREIINHVTDEPHNVGDPVSSVVISIKSVEGLPARAEIDAHCCRSYALTT